MWTDVKEAEISASWVDLPENGWGALIGWAAGLDNLRRRQSSDAGRMITGYIERGGKQQPFEEPFTAADRPGIDDDIDRYPRDAGLPPRPRGYVWMIRVPEGHASSEAFLAEVDTAIIRTAEGTVNPKQLRPIVATILRDFYARDI